MSYIITKSDGSTLTTVPDGQYDNITTSINLIGKNLFNYGRLQNENFVYLLENFAKATPPTNQLRGQLWFDTATKSLKVYTGSAWNILPSLSISSNSNSVSTGTFWYNTVGQQLFLNNGSDLVMIGPEAVAGYNTTRMVSTTLYDEFALPHPVIFCSIDGEVISILSSSEFTIGPSTPVDGFTNVVRGITFKDAPLANVSLYGQSYSAERANSLLSEDTSGYIFASTNATPDSLVQRDLSANITANGLYASEINAISGGTFTGEWSLGQTFFPTTDSDVDLGKPYLKWANIYSDSLQVTDIFFETLNDGLTNSINEFDTDVTLSSNSDSKLSTQRAVKTYVDTIAAGISTQVGYTGSRGITGYIGSQGVQGTIGPLGYDGSKGNIGYTGSTGIVGTVVTSVTASSPIASSGGATPNISLSTTTSAGSYNNLTQVISNMVIDTFGRITSITTASGFSQLASQDGWMKFPNGIIIQWGTNTVAANGNTTIIYPTPFSSFSVAVVSAGVDGNTGYNDNPPFTAACGTSSFRVFSPLNVISNAFWIAVGK